MGIQDWSLSDLTIGLCLIYLRQASTNPLEDVKGVQISSDAIVICSHLFYFLIKYMDLLKLCFLSFKKFQTLISLN